MSPGSFVCLLIIFVFVSTHSIHDKDENDGIMSNDEIREYIEGSKY